MTPVMGEERRNVTRMLTQRVDHLQLGGRKLALSLEPPPFTGKLGLCFLSLGEGFLTRGLFQMSACCPLSTSLVRPLPGAALSLSLTFIT